MDSTTTKRIRQQQSGFDDEPDSTTTKRILQRRTEFNGLQGTPNRQVGHQRDGLDTSGVGSTTARWVGHERGGFDDTEAGSMGRGQQ